MSDYLDLYEDRGLRRVLTLGASLLFIVPFLQAGSQLWPLQFGNIQWRYAAANSLSAVLLLPFLGLSILLVVSRLTNNRGLSTFIGAIGAVFSAMLAASLVVFVLDALQLKSIVSTQMETAFKSTTFRVGMTATFFTVAYLILAFAGFKAPRDGSASAGRRSNIKASDDDEAAKGLILGR